MSSQPPSRKSEKASKTPENANNTSKRIGSVKDTFGIGSIKDPPKKTESAKDTVKQKHVGGETTKALDSERDSARKYVKFMVTFYIVTPRLTLHSFVVSIFFTVKTLPPMCVLKCLSIKLPTF